MKDNKLKNNIKKIAKIIGVTLNWRRDPTKSVQWNGKDIACRNQTYSNIIHDIAHYAVASPARRAIFDFGLGRGPDSHGLFQIVKLISKKLSDKEEKLASAIGISWEKSLGMDWKYTVQYHAWGSGLDSVELYWFRLGETKYYNFLFVADGLA